MTHTIMVEHGADEFRATPLGMPDVTVTAPTREEALRGVAAALASRLAQVEMVQIEVPLPLQGPLAATAGLLKHAPEVARRIAAEAYAARDAEDAE